MPSPKQMEKLEAEAVRKRASAPSGTESADMPPEYWDAVLSDPSAGARSSGGVPVQQRRLSEIPRHVLRVSCRRCDRTIEIQKTDAVRLYGEHAIWKDVGQRLLDNTCRERTGRYEEDGCWPSFS
ncbi:hypothetical protein [Rhodopseudomonas boonkerdii]|uniref:hypothetical protein n=1 Tax=Rhodopseudomonas boonkerdii TaxID=475937 RepID=UPI001E4B0FCC|nr:hypothetical protein [Rhodopseudomonas boonkerdii]